MWQDTKSKLRNQLHFFFKILSIYLTEIEAASERGNTSRGSGRGRSRLPVEKPDVGLNPRIPRSRPELKADRPPGPGPREAASTAGTCSACGTPATRQPSGRLPSGGGEKTGGAAGLRDPFTPASDLMTREWV